MINLKSAEVDMYVLRFQGGNPDETKNTFEHSRRMFASDNEKEFLKEKFNKNSGSRNWL